MQRERAGTVKKPHWDGIVVSGRVRVSVDRHYKNSFQDENCIPGHFELTPGA